jgi:hypothetical protein
VIPLQVEQKDVKDNAEFYENLKNTIQTTQPKPIAYFDESVTAFIILQSETFIKGKLSLEIQYSSEKHDFKDNYNNNLRRNGRNISAHLDNPIYQSEEFQIWKYCFDVIPGRYYSNISIVATYEKENDSVSTMLKPFEEVNLIQIEGVDLLNDSCVNISNANSTINESDSTESSFNGNSSNSLIKSSFQLNISSLYKMSLKSYKTEKTLAWLDLTSSKTVNDLATKVTIESINIECVSCDVLPCTAIKFPVDLSSNILLTMAYQVSYDDESTIKPLIVIIDAIVDDTKHITTKWTSNLDLSNHTFPGSNSSSTLNFGHKKNQQPQLLPAAKLSKLRSYNSLVSNQNIPKLPPPRSLSNVSVNGNSPSTNTLGNNVLGGKRYSSVRLKSGSNLSLSQLWAENTSQNSQRGLVVTVSGPTRVKLGETFRWKIQLLNKSVDKMDLILYVQSSIKKEYEKTVPPIPIQSGSKTDIVPLFTNNQLVRSFYYKFNRAGLVSLTNNLRVGLEYGNLYECELELMSVERGMFNIYDFKVLDITSGDIFECNRLLDVMVV